MRFSEAKNLKVVSRATAETVGKITDYVIDSGAGQLAALRLKQTHGRGDSLAWSDIVAFGDDAVIVATEDVLVDPSGDLAELADKRHNMDGKRVLTTDGVELGNVTDVDFDQATGKILALDMKGQSLAPPKLLGVGSYAVIVEA